MLSWVLSAALALQAPAPPAVATAPAVVATPVPQVVDPAPQDEVMKLPPELKARLELLLLANLAAVRRQDRCRCTAGPVASRTSSAQRG